MKKAIRNQMGITLVIATFVALFFLPYPFWEDRVRGGSWIMSATSLGIGIFVASAIYIDSILEARSQKQWENHVRYTRKFIAKAEQEALIEALTPCEYCNTLIPYNHLKCPNCGAPRKTPQQTP